MLQVLLGKIRLDEDILGFELAVSRGLVVKAEDSQITF